MIHLNEALSALKELKESAAHIVQSLADCKPHLGAPQGLDTVELYANQLGSRIQAVEDQINAYVTNEHPNRGTTTVATSNVALFGPVPDGLKRFAISSDNHDQVDGVALPEQVEHRTSIVEAKDEDRAREAWNNVATNAGFHITDIRDVTDRQPLVVAPVVGTDATTGAPVSEVHPAGNDTEDPAGRPIGSVAGPVTAADVTPAPTDAQGNAVPSPVAVVEKNPLEPSKPKKDANS